MAEAQPCNRCHQHERISPVKPMCLSCLMKPADKEITLPWMNELRQRLMLYRNKEKQWFQDPKIVDFIWPIIEYGRSEEKRITEHFRK